MNKKIGLDCGTANFLVASDDGITLQRNAFITLDAKLLTSGS